MLKKTSKIIILAGCMLCVSIPVMAQSGNSLVDQAKIDCDGLKADAQAKVEDVINSKAPAKEDLPSSKINQPGGVMDLISKFPTELPSLSMFDGIGKLVMDKLKEFAMKTANDMAVTAINDAKKQVIGSALTYARNTASNAILGSTGNAEVRAKMGEYVGSGINQAGSAVNTDVNRTASGYIISANEGAKKSTLLESAGNSVSSSYDAVKNWFK